MSGVPSASSAQPALPGAADAYFATARAPHAPDLPASGGSESGLRVREALAVTALALTGSLVLQLSLRAGDGGQVDRAVREGLVATLFFYLGLGGLLAWYVVARRVRLTWIRGSALDALALGLPLGAVGGALAVALNSAVSGRLTGDPTVEMLVGGGGALRILVTLAVTTLLAPLVEETLFRGVLAGSLLSRGVPSRGAAVALTVSAVAFAVWHMNPTSLRYYAVMGLLLAALWHKRGLLASVAMHAAFNGVLTVAAIAATGGAGQFTTYGDVSFVLPGGWHEVRAVPTGTTYEGPAAAALHLSRSTPTRDLTLDELSESLRGQQGSADLQVSNGSVRVVALGGVDGVVADVTTAGQPGHVLRLSAGGSVYTVLVVTSGSPNAERDWLALVRSLRLR